MDKLDSIRQRQSSSEKAKSTGRGKRKNSRKKKAKARLMFKTAVILAVLIAVCLSATVIWATWGMDFDFADSFNKYGMSLSSMVYYTDDDGNLVPYERLIADENRIWVDFAKIPETMKDAFVAIEDQRFYKHGGVDIRRTLGAVINVVLRGDSSYGGSTITQQLVKNITQDKERSKARKIREMVRAIILETKMEKDEILELYMNSIYLGHGANGVQAASHIYFDKDVSELSLVECAAIAGITQHPSTYDPKINPEGNKEKRQLVLDKMFELEYIDKEQYEEASDAELKLSSDNSADTAQSYFVDCLFEELLNDLINVKGYTSNYATNLIYNGGLKIVGTVDPKVQSAMEDVYENGNGFPVFYGEAPESAMIITEPATGHIKGVVGGKGKKQGARVLNRATQTKRQPGSTIKPIAVYGPAIDTGVITLSTVVENSPLNLNGWEPKNANKKFTPPVSIRTAVASSLNLPAIRVLEELGLDKSFEYMTERLHLGLIKSKRTDTGIASDKGYAPLALGGLTEGITVSEMNSAYATFANKGVYISPTSYTKVYDSSGNILLSKVPERNQAFSEETAFIMNQLLKGVVTSGTAAGSTISGMDTCGKTGSADDNKDRWFVGYTPYYSAAVWVGYDEPRVISYGGVNPALTIWRAVMNKIHKQLPGKTFTQPEAVKRAYACSVNPKFATSICSGVTDYINTNIITEYCSGDHSNTIGTHGVLEEEEEEEKEPSQDGENSEGEDTTSENSESTSENNSDVQPEQAPPAENTVEQGETVSQE